jgi:hypothetical protein
MAAGWERAGAPAAIAVSWGTCSHTVIINKQNKHKNKTKQKNKQTVHSSRR